MVLIRKSRGPCFGLLDLPGGSPEINETEEQTLARELEEECGVLLGSIHRQVRFSTPVELSSTGGAIQLTHSGLIKPVNVFGQVRRLGAIEVVASVELFDSERHSLGELTPVVLEAIQRFPEFGFACPLPADKAIFLRPSAAAFRPDVIPGQAIPMQDRS